MKRPGFRIRAGFVALLLTVSFLLSIGYILKEADHECTGEDCPVCACISQCTRTISETGIQPKRLNLPAIPFLYAPAAVSFFLFSLLLTAETPISRNIRINS